MFLERKKPSKGETVLWAARTSVLGLACFSCLSIIYQLKKASAISDTSFSEYYNKILGYMAAANSGLTNCSGALSLLKDLEGAYQKYADALLLRHPEATLEEVSTDAMDHLPVQGGFAGHQLGNAPSTASPLMELLS